MDRLSALHDFDHEIRSPQHRVDQHGCVLREFQTHHRRPPDVPLSPARDDDLTPPGLRATPEDALGARAATLARLRTAITQGYAATECPTLGALDRALLQLYAEARQLATTQATQADTQQLREALEGLSTAIGELNEYWARRAPHERP